MKLLLIALFLLTSTTTFARSVTLHSEKINLGILEQETSLPALEEITVKRTAKTPKKVELKFEYVYRAKVCQEWEDRVIVIPGNVICTPDGCYTTAPETRVERFCVYWENELLQNSKKVKLNFSKATKLSSDQKESFLVVIEQQSLDKKKVKLAGQTLDAQSDYTIKFSDTLFTRPTLKFIAD